MLTIQNDSILFNNSVVAKRFPGPTQNKKVVITDSCDFNLDRTTISHVGETLIGTTLTVFSIPELQAPEEIEPWQIYDGRAYFLSTFKSLDGHSRNWLQKDLTFGQMFEEIAGDALESVLQLAATCAPTFIMQHLKNDNSGRVTHNALYQVLIWKDGDFISPAHTGWTQPTAPIRQQELLLGNSELGQDENEPWVDVAGDSIQVNDMTLTKFSNGKLEQVRIINQELYNKDEFYKLSRDKYCALFICRGTPLYGWACTALFSSVELGLFYEFAKRGEEMFASDLYKQYTKSEFVRIPKKLYEMLVRPNSKALDEQDFIQKCFNKLISLGQAGDYRLVEVYWKSYCFDGDILEEEAKAAYQDCAIQQPYEDTEESQFLVEMMVERKDLLWRRCL